MEKNSSFRISLAELSAATKIVLDRLIEREGEWIDIDRDYYWEFLNDDQFDISKDPNEFSVGQLSEDWMRVQETLAEGAEPIGYSLIWAASLMKLLGKKFPA